MPAQLDPGGSVDPLPVFNGAGATTVAFLDVDYSIAGGPIGTTGVLTTRVITNAATNPYGLQYYGFVYLLSVTTGAVASVTVDGYSGVGTFVKGCANANCIFSNTVNAPAPDSATRSSNGDSITFFYDSPLPAGSLSEFNTYTNSLHFIDPAITITDTFGNTMTIETLGPSPVPGPIVGAGLPGLALAALGMFGWRRRIGKITA
jgi:hypothetical protein